MDEYAYQNITVSGLPGAGSSTLAKSLVKILGWQYFGGGDFMRQYAIEQGLFDKNNNLHHDATVYNDDFDRQVDFQMRKTLESSSNNVLDAWLSGFMAQGVGGVFKILVTCSDDAIRIDRVVNRDQITVTEAKKHVFEREEKNLKKWQKMYQSQWQEWIVERNTLPKDEPIYFWNPKLYDLVLDTFHYGPEETLEIVIDKIRKK
jgi:CMP/dCMP kinase